MLNALEAGLADGPISGWMVLFRGEWFYFGGTCSQERVTVDSDTPVTSGAALMARGCSIGVTTICRAAARPLSPHPSGAARAAGKPPLPLPTDPTLSLSVRSWMERGRGGGYVHGRSVLFVVQVPSGHADLCAGEGRARQGGAAR